MRSRKSEISLKLGFSFVFLAVFVIFSIVLFYTLKNTMDSSAIIPITGFTVLSEDSCFRVDSNYEEITDQVMCCKLAAASEGCKIYPVSLEKNQYLCSFTEKRFAFSTELMNECLQEGYEIKMS